MKILAVILFIIFPVTMAMGQHQADRWYFGMNAGMDFNNGAPIAIPGSVTTTEGTTSASDSAGNLLFYTDGMTVWDKNGVPMPNGTGLFGSVSSTTSAITVPHPGNGNLHYIFTTDEATGTNGFCYSVVDMSLQAGNGDITIKNIQLHASVTEKISAVQQAGTSNYWVTMHEWGTDAFYSYLVDASGLQTTPVISNAGLVHTVDPLEQNKYGQMKFNTCGNQLALAIGYMDTVQILDFDPVTAQLSNPITLPLGDHVYGVEFSHDGNILYVTSYNTASGYGNLVQYDISSGIESTINASKLILSTNTSGTSFYYGLQLASNKSIYVCTSWSQFLGVIDNPEIAGTGCLFTELGFDLDPNFAGATAALGLPSFVQSLFRGETSCTTPVTVAEMNPAAISVYPTVSATSFNLATKNQFLDVMIFDCTGRLIANHKSVIGENFVFGNELTRGSYFITVMDMSEAHHFRVIKL